MNWQGAQTGAVIGPQGTIVLTGGNSQPLMVGGLERAVGEMEGLLTLARRDEERKLALQSLDELQRLVMEARRVLRKERRELEEALERAAEEASESKGIWLFFHRTGLAPAETTPLQEAWMTVREAVSSIRQAMDLGEAGKALDALEESIVALRALLWKTVGSGRA